MSVASVADLSSGAQAAAPPAATPPATAVTPASPNGSAEAADQAQALRLTNQIEAQGRQLDQLAEATNAAQIHSQQIEAQVQTTQRTLAATAQWVTAAAAQVRNQAVSAYVGQPQPSLMGLSMDPNAADAVALTYVESVARVEQQSIDRLQGLRKQQSLQLATLTRQQDQAHKTVVALQADQRNAQKVQSSQQALLAGVRGNLAILVAEDQQAQQQAQQAQLARTETLPPAPAATVAQAAASTGSSATPGVTRIAPAPTTGATITTPAPNSSAALQTAAPQANGPTTARNPAVSPIETPRAPVTAAPPTARAAPPTARAAPPTARAAPPSTRPAPPSTRPAPPASPATSSSPTTSSRPTPLVVAPAVNSPAPGAQRAIATAEAQMGKRYQWGGAGPSSFDCSGLVMVAWASAGVYFPHLAQDQYNLTERIPLSSLLPGDLVFFGTPSNVYHVGIYVGGGDMVDAPSTGQDVQIQSIYWGGLLGAGRVTG